MLLKSNEIPTFFAAVTCTIGGFGTFLCLAMVNLISVFFVHFYKKLSN